MNTVKILSVCCLIFSSFLIGCEKKQGPSPAIVDPDSKKEEGLKPHLNPDLIASSDRPPIARPAPPAETTIKDSEIVAGTPECTTKQKKALDKRGLHGNKPSDVINARCIDVTDVDDNNQVQEAFDGLRSSAFTANRALCKWTYKSSTWFCSPDKETDPNLNIEGVFSLKNCTRDQKELLDTTWHNGDKPSEANDLCVNVTDKEDQSVQASFSKLLNEALSENRESCKWSKHSEEGDLANSTWFCSPKHEVEHITSTATDPNLTMKEAMSLYDCTKLQKDSLDRQSLVKKPSKVGDGLCVNITDVAKEGVKGSFEGLRDSAVAGNRTSCKWIEGDSIWYCSPRHRTVVIPTALDNIVTLAECTPRHKRVLDNIHNPRENKIRGDKPSDASFELCINVTDMEDSKIKEASEIASCKWTAHDEEGELRDSLWLCGETTDYYPFNSITGKETPGPDAGTATDDTTATARSRSGGPGVDYPIFGAFAPGVATTPAPGTASDTANAPAPTTAELSDNLRSKFRGSGTTATAPTPTVTGVANPPSETGGYKDVKEAFANVENLSECSTEQKNILDKHDVSGDNPSETAGGLCVNVTSESTNVGIAFNNLYQRTLAEKRTVCKWTYKYEKDGLKSSTWYCSPQTFKEVSSDQDD